MIKRGFRALLLGYGRILRAYGTLWSRILARFPPSQEYLGIRLGAPGARYPHNALQRVREALDLTHAHDPGAFARVQRSYPRILVMTMRRSSMGRDRSLAGHVELSEDFVVNTRTTPGALASLLVRLGMLAHLRSLGVRPKDGRRAKVSVLLAMAELNFARRLRDGAELEQRASTMIDEAASTRESAADDAYHARVQRALPGALADYGLPRWLAGPLRRLFEWARRVEAERGTASR